MRKKLSSQSLQIVKDKREYFVQLNTNTMENFDKMDVFLENSTEQNSQATK